MNTEVSSFAVPLVFDGISILHNSDDSVSDTQNIIERSFSSAHPSVLECYAAVGFPVPSGSDRDQTLNSGVVIGCQDGTLYVFHPSCQPANAVESPSLEIVKSPGTRSPSSSRSIHTRSRSSRTISPTGSTFNLSTTPFNLMPRPRVVSGLNKEQIEAPKNYVDFDDEPDKLKDMLKGKSPREKTHHGLEKGAETPLTSSQLPGLTNQATHVPKQKEPAKPLLSAKSSPIHTPRSYSPSLSPREHASFCAVPAHDLTLRCHFIPPKSGTGMSVSCLKFIHNDQVVAMLQEAGNLYLISSDDGSCLVSIDMMEEALESLTNGREREVLSNNWLWCSMAVCYTKESTFLLVSAAKDSSLPYLAAEDPEDDDPAQRSLSVLFEFFAGGGLGSSESKLVKLNQWIFDGSPKGMGIYKEADDIYSLFHINAGGHLIVSKLIHNPLPSQSLSHEQDNHSTHHLQISNPFKSIKSVSAEHPLLDGGKPQLTKLILDEMCDAGNILCNSALGVNTYNTNGALQGIAWTNRELVIFEYREKILRVIYRGSASDVKDARWLHGDIYAVSYMDRVESYQLKLVNADNDNFDLSNNQEGVAAHLHPELLGETKVGPYNVMGFVSSSAVMTSEVSENGEPRFVNYAIQDALIPVGSEKPRVLWKTAHQCSLSPLKPKLTSMLPLELDMIVQGYTDGHLRQFTLKEMCDTITKSLIPARISSGALSGSVVGLHSVQNPRTKEKYLAGGADDGSISFWTNNFDICARWTVFTSPIVKVIQFPEEKGSPLRGCVLFISCDGTIAVIVIDGFHFLCLVPGSTSALLRVGLGGNNLLLIYADRRARLWDVQTKEFWRSMNSDKADELLNQGGWTVLSLEDDACVPNTPWRRIVDSYDGWDAVSSLSLDLEQVTNESIAITKSISTSRDQTRAILLTLERFRLILSTLLTPGLSQDVDSICHKKLCIQTSSVSVGFHSLLATTFYHRNHPQELWCISGNVSAARILSIVFVLRAMKLEEAANTVIAFYTTSLATCIGPLYQSPSLAYLGRRWFYASTELRHAIRVVFDSAVACMSDEEATSITELWQHHSPCLQPEADRESTTAALALFICGHVASQKYSLLSTNALTDISKSVTLYLHDEKSIYRVLAIDLCSRGFHVWQHYIDAMEILRSLFTLATGSRKDSISLQNVGAQARAAVLNIASEHTGLFMTTLCLDILNPPTLEHRRSVMQIVAFLIRKRPLVLQPNLPKLMEAVVKSLDPNSTANREAVLDTATEIIGYVVKTFLTVDFHMASQRLAVGTNEGAVVMYDVKTAIRLYVLEGHKKQLTACSFSPDGRRLVTLSLEESVVLVWKVGSSFTSFFNPGAPPRQGHGGSEPFKTLSFNVGSEANMSVADTFEKIRFDWVGDRSLKLKIRDSVLTFST